MNSYSPLSTRLVLAPIAVDRSSAPQVRPIEARRGAAIGVEREHRLRRLGRDRHDADRPRRYAVALLERGQVVIEHDDVARRLDLRQDDAVRRAAGHRDEVGQRQRRPQRVDADPQLLARAVGAAREVLARPSRARCRCARPPPRPRGRGSARSPRCLRLRHLLLAVAGDEQQRLQHRIVSWRRFGFHRWALTGIELAATKHRRSLLAERGRALADIVGPLQHAQHNLLHAQAGCEVHVRLNSQ